MLWIESGGPGNPAWKTRPLQIGNPGDPALAVLKNRAENSALVMSDELHKALLAGRHNEPAINIQAGIAYLYARMIKTDIVSVTDETDKQEYVYEVVSGDTLTKIAGKVDTTVDELAESNPLALAGLRPKQRLKYHKAQMKRAIVGWRHFTSQNIAQRYNVGDPDYAAKIGYLMNDVFPKISR
jgi:hypothetical protein